jgi:hypothetical protein
MAEDARASPTYNPRGIDTLEVTGPGKINLIKIEKKPSTGFLSLIKSTSLRGKENVWVSIKSIIDILSTLSILLFDKWENSEQILRLLLRPAGKIQSLDPSFR